MAVVWTSDGKKTASASAVGTGQGDTGPVGPQGPGIEFWSDFNNPPTPQDVIDNGWANNTVVFAVDET